MKKLLPISAATALMVCGSAVSAAELPTFEVMGFPITLLQVALMGGSGVEEQSPSPTLTSGGMPASPHQMTVLTPRPRVAEQPAAANLTTVGFSAK